MVPGLYRLLLSHVESTAAVKEEFKTSETPAVLGSRGGSPPKRGSGPCHRLVLPPAQHWSQAPCHLFESKNGEAQVDVSGC